jgi:hypothetical protein
VFKEMRKDIIRRGIKEVHYQVLENSLFSLEKEEQEKEYKEIGRK